MSQTPNLFLSIGKEIKDEYGRVVGKIASFAVTPNGKFDVAFVQRGGGKFSKVSIEHLRFNGADVILTPKIKSEANIFCDQIPLIWRKDQALKDLVEKKKISPELYEELHNSFDGALTQLKTEAQILVGDIDREVSRCAEEARELNYALVHLEIEHEIGKVDDQTYTNAFAIIQENIKRVSMERSDFEQTRNKLSNMMLGESLKTADTAKRKETPKAVALTTGTELPEPPVVVYVKEIGKTNA